MLTEPLRKSPSAASAGAAANRFAISTAISLRLVFMVSPLAEEELAAGGGCIAAVDLEVTVDAAPGDQAGARDGGRCREIPALLGGVHRAGMLRRIVAVLADVGCLLRQQPI